MRRPFLLLAGFLCAGISAHAQVTVDLHALDALPGARPPAPEARPRRTPPKPSQRPATSATLNKPSRQSPAATPEPPSTAAATAPSSTAPQQPAPQAVPAPPAATLPTAAPPVIALAPVPPPPPAAQAPPPPPPPISDTANSAASAAGAGLRLTFGAGESDLSPASAAAIQGMVKGAPQAETISYNVIAYAAGTPEDPSTARRLSLARALAVRSALIADGVSSARIYVRALGAQGGDAPADRVDLSILGANAPPIPASAPADAPSPAPSRQP